MQQRRAEFLKDMQQLWYATNKQFARLKFGAVNNSNETKCGKVLNYLVEAGDLQFIERGNGKVFMLKRLDGLAEDHCLSVTEVLVDILRCYPKSKIYREPDLGMERRPDAVVILKDKGKSLALIMEVKRKEPQAYLAGKLKAYEQWNGKWFTDRGLKSANFLVIGKVGRNVGELGVRSCEKFTKEVICGRI